MPAEEVARLAGVTPELSGNQGEPKRPGSKTLLNKSYVIFSKSLPEDSDMAEDLSFFLSELGGVEKIMHMKEIVNPKFIEFNFYLPSRTSETIQDGYLSCENIEAMYNLKATIGFNYF
ncbi:hypothetical protein [Pseudomonas syringae]|nr:hypothetical protein [Pseudomonas syringae]